MEKQKTNINSKNGEENRNENKIKEELLNNSKELNNKLKIKVDELKEINNKLEEELNNCKILNNKLIEEINELNKISKKNKNYEEKIDALQEKIYKEKLEIIENTKEKLEKTSKEKLYEMIVEKDNEILKLNNKLKKYPTELKEGEELIILEFSF